MSSVADRNNNPGNLIPPSGKIIWQGQTGVDDRGFAIFSTRDAGIRAADLNLQTYSNHGWTTLYDIIHHWSNTDQDAYTGYVSQNLGVSPYQHVDLANPSVRQGILSQIFNFEGSSTRYSKGSLADAWSAIQHAVTSGNPLDVPAVGIGAVTDAATNVFGQAISNGVSAANDIAGKIDNAVGGAVSSALNLSGIQDWVDEHLIAIAVGLGAVLLVFVSGFGLVKNTDTGGAVIRTGSRTAALAFV